MHFGLLVGIIVSTNMVSFVFQNPAGIFKNLRKFVLAVGGPPTRKLKLEAKLAGLKACFAYEQRNFYSNSVIINRLRRPQVNTLQENFTSNLGLKRKFSIFRTTLYFTLLAKYKFILETRGSILAMWDKLIIVQQHQTLSFPVLVLVLVLFFFFFL